MAFQFPASPSVGDKAFNGDIVHQWDGVKWMQLGNQPQGDWLPVALNPHGQGARIGFNLEDPTGAGPYQTVDAGPSALMRLRSDTGDIDFHVAASADADAVPALGRTVRIDNQGLVEAHGGLRTWFDNNPAHGVAYFGVGNSYVHWSATHAAPYYYLVGPPSGWIWCDGVNRGVRNNGLSNTLYLYYSGSDGRIHLQVDGSYQGRVWTTLDFHPSNYWALSEWNPAANNAWWSGGQNVNISWDGWLQGWVNGTHVGGIYTNLNFSGVTWTWVSGNFISDMRFVWAGEMTINQGEAFGAGAAMTGFGPPTSNRFRFRYMQYAVGGAYYTFPGG